MPINSRRRVIGVILVTFLVCLGMVFVSGCGGMIKQIISPPPATPVIDILPPQPPIEEPPYVPEYLGWMDIGHPSAQFDHLETARQTSNILYLRVERGEWDALLPEALNGWKGIILKSREGYPEETADAAKAIVDAGGNLLYILDLDEPDLGPAVVNGMSMTDTMDRSRWALKTALRNRGLGDIPVGHNWSLAAGTPWTWQERVSQFGTPEEDVFITDSWYTPKGDELHLVRDRTIRWLDHMISVHGPKPIVHILKVFSRVPPDLENLYPEWVLRQLRCVAGAETSEYQWTNPSTLEVANVVVEPLPNKYRGTVLLYKMDPTRNGDTDFAGGNSPDVVAAIRGFCEPRGLTLN